TSNIHQNLEHQYTGYRNYLQTIYILQSKNKECKTIEQAVLSQWDLVPETVNSIECIESFYDNENFDGLVLVICLQRWSGDAS
ncbi:hypothetical protein NXH39_31100, partial [Klebsiella pneumoniae]|nr:hypothetical protein [Klebsiella pneumoniae]